MLVRTVRVATIQGVEVRLDPSVGLLVLLVGGLLTTRFLAANDLVVALLMAVVGAVLVVVTTFLHELAHALEARHRGLEVEAITLLLFGGVTEMHADGQTARDELAIAAVGPWVSLVCAATFGLIATYASDVLATEPARLIAEVAGLLGWWNLLLAVFNIVPGAPLDGGRVLRAVLWMLLGDRMRALRISVRAGQVLGFVLVAGGLWVLATGRFALVVGLIGALVLATTGLFIANAAARELKQAELEQALTGRTVADLMAALPSPWPPEAAVSSSPTEPGDELPAVDHQADLEAGA
ncbi:MAG: site-2 protease family protein, partial [Actinomycetota bacterium]